MKVAQNIYQMIGNTPVLKIPSLSELCGNEIYVKCEHLNPGGSVKDRAALQMITDAVADGRLKPGMSIVEGTAGNTGIGLSLVGRAMGYPVEIVMPNNQSKDKEELIRLYGGQLKLVDPVPFANPAHFYHQAKAMAAAEPERYWWADQFENLSNQKAHYFGTGQELIEQLDRIDHFVSTGGSGGTIAGISRRLKEHNPNSIITLADPNGSGLKSYVESKEFRASGSSFTEGIGIMRLVNNFRQAHVDGALRVPDEVLVAVAHYVQQHDALLLGLSSALNLTAAFAVGLQQQNKRQKIVTISCDMGERSRAKLYSPDFLQAHSLTSQAPATDDLLAKVKNIENLS